MKSRVKNTIIRISNKIMIQIILDVQPAVYEANMIRTNNKPSKRPALKGQTRQVL